MSFHVFIPARYQSSRLPGKILMDIGGKPMLQHVYEKAGASGAKSVIIATDDSRVATIAQQFGANVCMTATTHQTGTDRIAEAARQCGIAADDIIVNVQGDEPLLPSELIAQVAKALQQAPQAAAATLRYPVTEAAALSDPGLVKVVCDVDDFALYFSRASIPHVVEHGKSADADNSDATNNSHFWHIGIYAYRAGFLQQYVVWPPCPLEQQERLEQLRILWHGRKIIAPVALTAVEPGVNTADDLARVRALLCTAT